MTPGLPGGEGPTWPSREQEDSWPRKKQCKCIHLLWGKYPLFPTFKLSESLASLRPFFFLSGMKAWLFKRATEPLTLGSLSKWDFEAVNPAGRALLTPLLGKPVQALRRFLGSLC